MTNPRPSANASGAATRIATLYSHQDVRLLVPNGLEKAPYRCLPGFGISEQSRNVVEKNAGGGEIGTCRYGL